MLSLSWPLSILCSPRCVGHWMSLGLRWHPSRVCRGVLLITVSRPSMTGSLRHGYCWRACTQTGTRNKREQCFHTTAFICQRGCAADEQSRLRRTSKGGLQRGGSSDGLADCASWLLLPSSLFETLFSLSCFLSLAAARLVACNSASYSKL